MENNLVKIKIKEKVATILLNHPAKKNALDDKLIKELVQALDRIDRDPDVNLALLGSATNVFCSGGDVKAMLKKEDMFQGSSIDLRRQYHEGIQEMARAMERFRKPIIAVLDGAAVGAGADLSCMCDLRMGSSQLRFKETFANLALVPGDGGTFFLTRVLGYAKAMELYLTTDEVDGQRAYELGLLNFLCKDETLWEEADRLAQKLASKPPVALQMTKQALKEAYSNHNLESNLNLLSAFQAITQRSQDHDRGLSSLKGEKEKFEGN